MANKNAVFKVSVTYPDGSNNTQSSSNTVSAPFSEGARIDAGIDVPDLALSGTEYALSFGSIAAATALHLENKTGQDVHVRLNGQPASVSGTLVAGTKTMALAAVTGEHLSAELVTAHGTPGILSVRRSGGNVIVESWLAGTGLETADVSDVKVSNGGSPNLFRLPTGGSMTILAPAAAGASAIASASVLLSDAQDGAGSISYKIFGDPT